MKTFKFELGLDMKVVSTDKFLQDMRDISKSEEASEFLRDAAQRYPDDDEAFILFILKNGIRRNVRHRNGHDRQR